MKCLGAILLISLVACSQGTPDSDNTYRISAIERPTLSTNPEDPPPPPPPPPAYYLPANFVIDSAGQVYFYQQPHYGSLRSTNPNNNKLPDFIDLQPEDIVRIPDDNIKEFIQDNIVTLDRSDRLVAIALMKDTVTSSGLTKIFKVFNDTANDIKWIMRAATEEETIVLAYKQHDCKYYPNNLLWDSSKIHYIHLKKRVQYTIPNRPSNSCR